MVPSLGALAALEELEELAEKIQALTVAVPEMVGLEAVAALADSE